MIPMPAYYIMSHRFIQVQKYFYTFTKTGVWTARREEQDTSMMADINQTGMCEGVQDRREGGVNCFHSCACVCVCVCWPVMMRHSSWSRASVKRRDTMSSVLMRKRISSWTKPIPVTPPPTILFAKSTCSINKNTYSSAAKLFSSPGEYKKKQKKQFHPWTWCEIVLWYRDLWYLSEHSNGETANQAVCPGCHQRL